MNTQRDTKESRTLVCGHSPSEHNEHTTGTATLHDGREICWECAAFLDLAHMVKDGHSRRLPLYLSKRTGDKSPYKVSNWPDSLRFEVVSTKSGRHNIGRMRTDVWFVGPDGYMWHGVQIGDWNEICHARRTKQLAVSE